MNIKQFLKPNWKKIAITIILALPPFIFMMVCGDAIVSDCRLIESLAGIYSLIFIYYTIISPAFLIFKLLVLLGIPDYQNVLIDSFLVSIINLIYWYLFLSFIAWIYDMAESKPSIKKIIKRLLIVLLGILTIISGYFSAYMLLYEALEPGVRGDTPRILFITPFIFIFSILLLLKMRWIWQLFLLIFLLIILSFGSALLLSI